MEVLIVSKSFIFRESINVFLKNKFEGYKSNELRQLSEVNSINLKNIEFMIVDVENDSVDNLTTIKKMYNNIKIIIFDRAKDINNLHKSIKNKIDGYIIDLQEKEDLIYIFNRILRGKKYYDIEVEEQKVQSIDVLTNRENEIFILVGDGYSNKEISNELFISENTVKRHITSILLKMNMSNRKDLILYNKSKLKW